MAPEDSFKSAKSSKAELDAISNRIAVALAKRDKLVKSWTASSSRQKAPEKTQEQIDAEDAALFRNVPPYLGVGASIPSHFLVSDAERNNKSLRAKFFPTKGLTASKAREDEEKAASAKRGLIEESSDEEEGRSSLGKAKKMKMITGQPVKHVENKIGSTTNKERSDNKKSESLASLPTTTSNRTVDITIETIRSKPAEHLGRSRNQVHNTTNLKQEKTVSQPVEGTRKDRLKGKKRQKKKGKHKRNEMVEATLAP